MQILSAAAIKEWEVFTIVHEPIREIDLMERAAIACVQWLQQHQFTDNAFCIFCGKGNNGGDGLAIARLLLNLNIEVSTYIIDNTPKSSASFDIQLQQLQLLQPNIHFIQNENDFPVLKDEVIIIEAIWGLGLNRAFTPFQNQLINAINSYQQTIISIDIPAGMFADGQTSNNSIIKAHYTLSFECFKIAFLLPEMVPFLGALHLLSIGLLPSYTTSAPPQFQWINEHTIQTIFKPRNAFSHKGSHGHALVVAGSYGKMGAAVLATKAAVFTGAGLTTSFIPICGYEILQIAIPEAMVITSNTMHHLSLPKMDLSNYTAIGIGPGIGKHPDTLQLLEFILEQKKPLLLDADALNLLSENPPLLNKLTKHTILTPHPKEFDRLFGISKNSWERIQKAVEKANQLQIIIVLKGHYTMIFAPNSIIFCNQTGNAGLAKGGSGDTLTGMITALLVQKYTAIEAAILGVYLHGSAADKAVKISGVESLTATHILNFIGKVFLDINDKKQILL